MRSLTRSHYCGCLLLRHRCLLLRLVLPQDPLHQRSALLHVGAYCRCWVASAWLLPSSSAQKDMLDPEYGFTVFGPIGGVFVIGIGMLALGVPLMIACAVRFRAFFRGETLNEDTPILVPDTGEEPVALKE